MRKLAGKANRQKRPDVRNAIVSRFSLAARLARGLPLGLLSPGSGGTAPATGPDNVVTPGHSLTTAEEPRERPDRGARLRYLDVEPQPRPEIDAPWRSQLRHWVFATLVCAPIGASAAYLLFVAADRYTSQASFVIRDGGSAAGGAARGFVRNDESSYTVATYVTSRDATAYLAETAGLRELVMRSEADALTGFPRPWSDDSAEALHRYMRDIVSVDFDAESGITTLEVLAYRPQDAQTLAEALLLEAERLVNRMNVRGAQDAIAFAENVVAEGEARIRNVQQRMAEFRNAEHLIDPGAQTAAQLSLMAELSLGATGLDTEIAQLQASASRSPRLQGLLDRRAAIGKQIDDIRSGLVGSSASLAPKLSVYETLSLERELAVKSLTAGYRSLEQARQDAAANRLYLQRISAPNLPDEPSHPWRILTLLVITAACLCGYWIAASLGRVTMEHRP